MKVKKETTINEKNYYIQNNCEETTLELGFASHLSSPLLSSPLLAFFGVLGAISNRYSVRSARFIYCRRPLFNPGFADDSSLSGTVEH
ncbi:Unknown protein, partial [Striga hermonthica]